MSTYPFEYNQECSSGCESGWTLYLEHDSSINSPYHSCNPENDYHDGRRNRVFTQVKRLKREEEEEEEDEEEDKDLSMVSDASSGPPHFHEIEDGYNNGNDKNSCFYLYSSTVDASLSRNNNHLNRQKTKENQRRRRKVDQDQSSLLDDTASSPFFDFSSKSFGNTSSSGQPSMENHVLEYSQGYSTTQFEVRPPCQEQYDFFQYSSMSGNQLHQNQWLI